MIDWDEDDKRREQLERSQDESKKLVSSAYEKFFSSKEGQLIWADLCMQYLPDNPTTIYLNDGSVDVNATMISTGQHNVLKHMMNQSIQNDFSNFLKQRQEQLDVRRKSINVNE